MMTGSKNTDRPKKFNTILYSFLNHFKLKRSKSILLAVNALPTSKCLYFLFYIAYILKI